jgi:hypothetical protein
LPARSRKAQSRTPYGCTVGLLDDLGAAGLQLREGAVEVLRRARHHGQAMSYETALARLLRYGRLGCQR